MSDRVRGRFHSVYFKFRVQRSFAKKSDTECLAKETYLKEDQIKVILQSFSAFDENGDGKISKREIARAYKLAGFKATKTDIDEIVVEHDENDDGYIDFAEFFKAMRVKMITNDFENDRLKTAFRVLDTNQNGYITREELRHAISASGNPLTESEIDTVLKTADKNNDGKIDFNDYVEAGLDKSIF